MGKILTEADMRARCLGADCKEFTVEKGVFVTESAKEYAKKHGIKIKTAKGVQAPFGSMSRTPINQNTPFPYTDAVTGRGYKEKPEDMTHLRGNILVKKTDKRIEFRGSLDTLQAEIICLQVLADKKGENALVSDLGEVLEYVRDILGAEVKDAPLSNINVLGLNSEAIRYNSHYVEKVFGIKHPIPNYKMGELAVQLNLLRAKSRETELCAARAFEDGSRNDIIEALNRLSSIFYILECKLLSGKEEVREF